MSSKISLRFNNNNNLFMYIPSNLCCIDPFNDKLLYSLQSYSNILIQNSLLLSSKDKLFDIHNIKHNTIDTQQMYNVPIGKHLQITTNIEEDNLEHIFDTMESIEYSNLYEIKNVQINLHIINETNEPYGYCNQKVDILLSER